MFPFDERLDQAKAIRQVNQDLEAQRPEQQCWPRNVADASRVGSEQREVGKKAFESVSTA